MRVRMMIEKNVNQVSEGEKLSQPVTTPLGGTLFVKGHVLKQGDLEVLQAFLINKVHIGHPVAGSKQDGKASNQGKRNNVQTHTTSKQADKIQPQKAEDSNLYDLYQQTVKKTDLLFKEIEGGIPPAVLIIQQDIMPFIREALKDPTFIVKLPIESQVENYLAHHAVSVAALASLIGTMTDASLKEITQIALSGYLHNVGNLRIDTKLLSKTTELTAEEIKKIRYHPTYGYQILKNIPQLSEGVVLSALLHHEREDGSGYPLGFTAEKIHPYAKIVAIADTYHAMCSNRLHKQTNALNEVVELFREESKGKLNSEYVELFLNKVSVVS